MESQTEQYQSQDLAEQEPEQPQETQHSLPQPDQSSNESEQLEVQGTDEISDENVLNTLEENPELLSQDSDNQQQESTPEQEAIEYNSIDDIDLSSLSEDLRSQIEPILGLVQQEKSLLDAEKEAFKSARQEFTDLIEAMENSGYDVKPLQERIDEQNDFIETMSTDMIDTAWQAFTATHPEYDQVPDNARQLFSKELERLFDRHDGNTVLDRMNNAYNYSLWRSGVDKNSLSSEKSVTVSKKSETTSAQNKNAPKQAVIADGRIATSAPVRSVDQLDWGEVLDRHAHLLDR